MAKVTVVGAVVRKTSYCPQCRRLVPPGCRKKEGVKCPRCGFFSWADYKKYPPFDSIPEPAKESARAVERAFQVKGKEELEKKLGKGGSSDKGSVASRPPVKRSSNRGGGKDKPTGSKSGTKKSSGRGAKSKSAKGKKSTKK